MATQYRNIELDGLDTLFSAAVLGKLEYDDEGQSWLLEFGYTVANYEYLCTYPSHNQKGQEHLDEVLRRINNFMGTFMGQTIKGAIIQRDLEIEKCIATTRTFTKAIHKNKLYALFLISCCSWYVSKSSELSGESSSKHLNQLQDKAESHLRELTTGCQDVKINQTVLLSALKKKLSRGGGTFNLRVLLQELSRPVTVLLISADPRNASAARLDEERGALRRALRETDFRDRINIENIHGCYVDDIQVALNDHQPDILHFIGHGDKAGLYLEDRDNMAKLVPMTAFADLLKQYETIRLVILGTCYSQYKGQCIADAVGSLISMEGPIRNRDAIKFSKEFYKALGAGYEIKESFDKASMSGMLDVEAEFRAHLLRRGQEPHTKKSSVRKSVGWSWMDHRGPETSAVQWLLIVITILCVSATAI
ncbi:hypothetical protein RRF57_011215 [Xylaria bambusicola]|uniref:CHAT domain-containing protein n=1 Tax=Xylaria bambusicola TaxID=326684 RepID=A0AAN7UUH9_9PEZI